MNAPAGPFTAGQQFALFGAAAALTTAAAIALLCAFTTVSAVASFGEALAIGPIAVFVVLGLLHFVLPRPGALRT
jgi:hypothetical protein